MKETQHVEWKESWQDEYLKAICGFANAEGGVLVIGRTDKGAVVGVNNAKKLMENLPNKIRDVLGIMVAVNLLSVERTEVVEVQVEPYPSPISYKGKYYFRSGSTTQELKGAALEQFLLKKRGLHWDGVPDPGFSSEDFSKNALRLFKQKASASGRMDRAVLRDSRAVILDNLELSEKQYLKRAACLLFSDRPERHISGSWIKIGFFVTDDDLRYQDEVHGNLFEQVEKTLELLHTKYLKAYISYEGIQRRETFLFPYGALREAILNAIVHKDYGSGVPIQISVYDDKIVLWNSGRLPQGWTIKRLLGKHPSSPPNPLLANAFFRAGYIEAWGRGIEKIRRECLEHDIEPPIYDAEMAGLMLTFHANPSHLPSSSKKTGLGERLPEKLPEKLVEKLPEKLGKNRATIVQLMRTNPNVTIRELAQALQISRTATIKNIQILKSRGYINRLGPDKGGHWEVLK